MKSKLSIFKCLLLVFISALVFSGCSLIDTLFPTEEVETFSFSGYVYADSTPLEDATVSCGLSEVTTDEKGYYSFAGLTKVVQVTVSKEGYYFDDTLVYVKSDRNDVNFDGNKYFNINGTVKNGSEVVPSATITFTSRAGAYTTSANNEGNFYLSNLAGTATVGASYNNINFFSQECNKDVSFIEINSVTNITGTINCDYEAGVQDFVLKLAGEVVENAVKVNDGNSLTFNLLNVTPNTSLVLESNTYFIETPEMVITSTSAIEFNCEKYYSSVITAVSGNTILEDAQIFINSKKITVEKQNGEVVLNKLHNQNLITASLNGFNFSDVTVSAIDPNATLVGAFNLEIEVITDSTDYEGISICLNEVNQNKLEQEVTENIITFNNIQLNSIAELKTENYFVSVPSIEITSTQHLTFNLSKFYALNLAVRESNLLLPRTILETVVRINGEEYSEGLSTEGTLVVENLYGTNTLELELENYKFEPYYNVTLNNCTINAIAKKLFNISGVVTSGEINISGAKVYVSSLEDEFTTVTDQNGQFELTNIYDAGKLIIEKSGYDQTSVNFVVDSEYLNINLTYNVSGIIKCEDYIVEGVLVTSGKSTATSDEHGEFTLKNLQGNCEILFEKSFYNFNTYQVSCNSETRCLEVSCTYYITGTVTGAIDEDTGIAETLGGIKVVLIKGNSQEETTTRADGTFEFKTFNGKALSGSYLLLCDSNEYTLTPNYRQITGGGEYTFSSSGYELGGRITCGGIGVEGVSVKVGNQETTTDDNGYYYFDLITKSNVMIIPEKANYVFVSTNATGGGDVGSQLVTIDDNGRTDINFTCTYTVSGTVKSGNTALNNATVKIGEKTAQTNINGYYEISGIAGSASISVTLTGYDNFLGESLVKAPATINFQGYYTQKYKIVTGKAVNGIITDFIEVSGVVLQTNSASYISNTAGLISIPNAEIGTTFTLSKQGYNFESYAFAGYTENPVEINGSYNVSGKVLSGNDCLEGVLVSVNGEYATSTHSDGSFSLVLTGKNTLSFNLTDFDFEDIENVISPETINVYAKYSVTGVVTIGNTPLTNVKVTAGGITDYTNGAGEFTISGLYTEVTLILEKEGYEFEGTFTVNGTCNLAFTATYLISGYVTSGEIMVEGVLVTSSLGGAGVITNEDGYYEIKGQVGEVILTFEKNGYSSNSATISKYTTGLNVNLSYSIIINFSGIEDLTGIYISLNNIAKEYSGTSVTLNDLVGYNTIAFSKTGCVFTPAQIGVTMYEVYNVTITKYYSALFKVQTSFGLVKDAEVVVGGKLATLNADGLYEAQELSGTVTVNVNLKVTDASGKSLYSYTTTYGTGSISISGTYDINIDNNEYAYFMFTRAYQRLRDVYAYKINVNGTVKPQTDLTGDQIVRMTYKKVGNERLYENLNYGKGAAGVEPRVSLLTYVNFASTSDKPIKYQMPNGSSISSNYTANYDMKWNEVSYQDYSKKFGVSADGFFPYNITQENMQYGSITNITYNASTKQYSFAFKFGGNGNVNSLIVSNYQTLTSTMVEGQEIKSFSKINLTFTFDEFGNILQLVTDEEYTVFAVIATVKTTASMTYTYTTSNNTATPKLDISSSNAIRQTLTQNLPENVASTIKTLNTVIITKRRED